MQNEEQLQNEIRKHCIRPEPYRGYRATCCGDGAVLFVGPKGDEVKRSPASAEDWLMVAWSNAKAEIDKRVLTLPQ